MMQNSFTPGDSVAPQQRQQRSNRCNNVAVTTPTTLSHKPFKQRSQGNPDVVISVGYITTSVSSLQRNTCRKCKSTARFILDEDGFSHCLKCGSVDYENRQVNKPKPLAEPMRPSVLSLDYIGPYPTMKGKKMKVKVGSKKWGEIGVGGAIRYTASCPHCGEEMFYTEGDTPTGSVVKTKDGVRTYSVRCPDKHRVRMVMTDEEGFLGWR